MSGGPKPTASTTAGVVLVDLGQYSELTADLADDFRRAVEAFTADTARVVVDLSPLRFLDSAGFGALVSLKRRCASRGGDLCIAGPSRDVQTIFELTRAHRLFEIYPSVDEAVTSFGEVS